MSTANGYRLAQLCFLVAFLFRISILFGFGLNHKQDRFEMISVATTFARTGTLANAYMSMPTGPTAHVAPLYPILVGSIYRVFGEGAVGENVRQSLACAISSLRAGLLVTLALALGLSEATALTAGLMGAFYVGAFDTELKGDWEGPLAGALLLWLVLCGYRMAVRRAPSWRLAFAYGVAWGIALLVAPTLAAVLIALMVLWLAVQYRTRAQGTAVTIACCVAGVVIALAPWIARNYAVLGGFVWGRDNFGLELSLSNGPGAHWSNPQNSPRIYATHPSRYRPEAEKLASMGELAYNAERKREAFRWIQDHPGEFTRLTVLRAIHFWFPTGRNSAHTILLGGLTLMAFLGLALLWRTAPGAFGIVSAIWLSYPAMYYLIQWSSRYRLPIDWTLLLCAAVAFNELRRRLAPRATTP